MQVSHGFIAFKLSSYRAAIHAEPWGKVIPAATEWAAALTNLCLGYRFAFDANARLVA